jgi:excisionase family DNA binding protein
VSTLAPRTIRLQSLSASMLARSQEVASTLATPMLSVSEFATALNISTATVHRWLRNSTLKGFRTGKGWWRVPVAEVARLKGLV